jgi:predicted transcriptional regulator
MNDEASPTSRRLVELTADLVSAYVSNNALSMAALPEIITSVYTAASMLGKAAPEP